LAVGGPAVEWRLREHDRLPFLILRENNDSAEIVSKKRKFIFSLAGIL
jgi:hypothetical protein